MASRRVSQSQFSLLIMQLRSKGYKIISKERTDHYIEYNLESPNGMIRRVKFTINGWLTYI